MTSGAVFQLLFRRFVVEHCLVPGGECNCSHQSVTEAARCSFANLYSPVLLIHIPPFVVSLLLHVGSLAQQLCSALSFLFLEIYYDLLALLSANLELLRTHFLLHIG